MLILGIFWVLQLIMYSSYVVMLGLLVGITTKNPAYVNGTQNKVTSGTTDKDSIQP